MTSASVCDDRGKVSGCVPCVRMLVLQPVGRCITALSVLIGSISPLMWGLQQWVRTVLLSRLCPFGRSFCVLHEKTASRIGLCWRWFCAHLSAIDG